MDQLDRAKADYAASSVMTHASSDFLFQSVHWQPVVLKMAKQDAIAFYGTQYHARHTWITMALKHMSIKDVSYYARVSPEVILKHYADRDRYAEIPEF